MHRIRLRRGVIDQIKRDRNLDSDAQIAAVLGVTVAEVEQLRHGAAISPEMALLVATIQGDGFDLSRWVEAIDSEAVAS